MATQTLRRMRTANPNLLVLTVNCEAKGAGEGAGEFADVALDISEITGWYITEVRTYPDAVVPPTDKYDITIEDEDGFDVMGGTLADRADDAVERAFPLVNEIVIPVGEEEVSYPQYAGVPIYGDLTLKIANNSVESAITTIKIFLRK